MKLIFESKQNIFSNRQAERQLKLASRNSKARNEIQRSLFDSDIPQSTAGDASAFQKWLDSGESEMDEGTKELADSINLKNLF